MKDKSVQKMLYTVEEVAIVLHSNKDYVYELIKSKALPAIKLGRLKVRKETLEEFLKMYEGMDLSDPYNISEIKFK